MLPKTIFLYNQSLLQTTLVIVAIDLWSQDDVCQMILSRNFPAINRSFSAKKNRFRSIEHSVVGKLAEMPIPETLKCKLLPVIHGIGHELLYWVYSHQILPLRSNFPGVLSWSPRGIIDAEKTAKTLVRLSDIDIYQRFIIACNCCIEDQIPLLWSQLESERKNLERIRMYENQLVSYWSHKLEGKLDLIEDLMGIYADGGAFCMCMKTMQEANCVAAKHFFEKIDIKDEQLDYLMTMVLECKYKHDDIRLLRINKHADIFIFLVLRASDELQMKICRKYSIQILNMLIEWPFNEFFLKAASLMWDFLQPVQFLALLKAICYRQLYASEHCHYKQLFLEFWMASPLTFKKHVVSDMCNESLLFGYLLEIKFKEGFKHILSAATVQEKMKILSCERLGNMFMDNLSSGINIDWNLVEFLIRERVSSKSDVSKLKDEFMAYFTEDMHASERNTLDTFFKRFDDIV